MAFQIYGLDGHSILVNRAFRSLFGSVPPPAAVQLEEGGVAKPWEKEYIRKDGTHAPVLVGVVMLEPPRCIAFVLDLREEARRGGALACL